jgi:hypothetical protein
VTKQQWLAEAVAREGVRVLDGASTRAEASAVIAAAMTARPEFVAELIAALADKTLGKWLRDRETSGDLFQSEMFPGLPASLRIAPKRSRGVADMTAEDLDHAKNMLYARTENQMNGARDAAMSERAVFDEFYDQVRPLLSGTRTVGDVLGTIALGLTA